MAACCAAGPPPNTGARISDTKKLSGPVCCTPIVPAQDATPNTPASIQYRFIEPPSRGPLPGANVPCHPALMVKFLKPQWLFRCAPNRNQTRLRQLP